MIYYGFTTLAILNKIVNSVEEETNPWAARGPAGQGRLAQGDSQAADGTRSAQWMQDQSAQAGACQLGWQLASLAGAGGSPTRG